MRLQTVPVPGASTRILLPAFMAAAFVLLLLLPAFGQSTFNRTDGKISIGGLSVGVFDDIQDAQFQKNALTPYTDGTVVYLPLANPSTYLGTRGSHRKGDIAYLATGLVSPQHTFFGGALWVSNDRVNDFDDPGHDGRGRKPRRRRLQHHPHRC